MERHVNKERPLALFVAPLMPSDRGNGLAMRTGFLLDAYAKRFDVDLAVVPVAGGAQEITTYVTGRTRRAAILPLGAPDTQFSLISRVADKQARLAAFRQYGRPSAAARITAEVQRALLAWIGDAPYKLVHISRLYLSSLAEAWSHKGIGKPCLVLDCDEDDTSAYRRLAGLERKWGRCARADWFEAEAEAFKAIGARWLPRFDLVLAASAGEAQLLSSRVGERRPNIVPNVIPANTPRWSVGRAKQGRRDLIFVGNMSYLPNVDAVRWFGLRIWPRVRAAVPFPVRFVIIGPAPAPGVAALASRDVVITGAVEDVGPFYRSADIAIVPIRAGGGTRIKLLESADHGVPIVATSFGAAGTGLRSGIELILADHETDFAAACIKLLIDRKFARRLAAQACRTVRRHFNDKGCANRLLAAVDTCGDLGAKSA